VLRVLGNLLEMPDCHYLASEEIRDELASVAGGMQSDNLLPAVASARADRLAEISAEDLDVPIYQVDAVVRRAGSLQLTRDGRQAHPGATEQQESA
jgi:NADH-quinone oxidoreductase subunit G